MSEIYLTKHGTEIRKQGGLLLIKTPDGNSKILPLLQYFAIMAALSIYHLTVLF